MQKPHGGVYFEGHGRKGREKQRLFHCLRRCEPGRGGEPGVSPARRELAAHGISCAGKTARQITRQDCQDFDYIYYMDSSNGRRLRSMFPGETKFQPLLSRDVADPWYTGDFQTAYRDIAEGCRRILEELG